MKMSNVCLDSMFLLFAAILLSVINNGTVNMGDWSKEILENNGIDKQKFTDDIGDLFLNMLKKN